MSTSTIVVVLLLRAGTVSPGTHDPFDGVTYPEHVSVRGRADTTPVPSNDVVYPSVHAAFDKQGPAGPGVDVVSDRGIYGQPAPPEPPRRATLATASRPRAR